jgi:DNA-binding response OmpR family regulator
MRLLLVEDDPKISHFLLKGLREDQHVVELVENGTDAESRAATEEYDAILLDLMRASTGSRLSAPVVAGSIRRS